MAVEINRDNYFVVQGWMISELGLKGNKLLVYAIIHGFSQGGQGFFTGSIPYLMSWTNGSKPTVIESLKSLTEQGLIVKKERFENGVKFVDYQSKNLTGGGKETLPGVVKKLNQGGKETLPNNIDINYIDTILRKYSKGGFTEILKKSLADWLKYKQERKDKYTETELENLVAQIEKAAAQHGDMAMADVISKSIASGYKGIVFDWLKKSEQRTAHQIAAKPETQSQRNGADWMKPYLSKPKTAGEDPAIMARAEQLQRELTGRN